MLQFCIHLSKLWTRAALRICKQWMRHGTARFASRGPRARCLKYSYGFAGATRDRCSSNVRSFGRNFLPEVEVSSFRSDHNYEASKLARTSTTIKKSLAPFPLIRRLQRRVEKFDGAKRVIQLFRLSIRWHCIPTKSRRTWCSVSSELFDPCNPTYSSCNWSFGSYNRTYHVKRTDKGSLVTCIERAMTQIKNNRF